MVVRCDHLTLYQPVTKEFYHRIIGKHLKFRNNEFRKFNLRKAHTIRAKN